MAQEPSTVLMRPVELQTSFVVNFELLVRVQLKHPDLSWLLEPLRHNRRCNDDLNMACYLLGRDRDALNDVVHLETRQLDELLFPALHAHLVQLDLTRHKSKNSKVLGLIKVNDDRETWPNAYSFHWIFFTLFKLLNFLVWLQPCDPFTYHLIPYFLFPVLYNWVFTYFKRSYVFLSHFVNPGV